jgi:ubiquinone/menaquinone biosynthesis C-methylase UbiE
VPIDEHEPWQLTGSAAQLYVRYLVPAITSVWATDLVQRAALQVGERVLDAACGTGIVGRLAAQPVGERGAVVGLDFNPGMLTVARALPPPFGAAITWQEASVLAMPFPDAAFDAVLCQLGLQFFPDRPQALSEMRRVLVPGGRLLLSVFGPIEHNPATHALAGALERHLRADAAAIKRAEHALADTKELRDLATNAGFGDVTIDTVTHEVHFPSAREYVRIQLAATPLATPISELTDEQREPLVDAVVADVAIALQSRIRDGQLVFPQECHILSAHTIGQ